LTSTILNYSTELNRVLGGGFVRGSVALIAGEPGIGKSTLLLQLASYVANNDIGNVVYLSGEENMQQIVSRAHRLTLPTVNIYVLSDTDVDVAGLKYSLNLFFLFLIIYIYDVIIYSE